MINNETSCLNSFILSWNMRNMRGLPLVQSSHKSMNFGITGITMGEYPLEGWKKYFLEVPQSGNKKDISGRSNRVIAFYENDNEHECKRTMKLPKYADNDGFGLKEMNVLVRNWNSIGLPEDIPCIAIALNASGLNSDYREIQYVTVVAIWSDGICRIFSLDWYEGPLEDCITPEWYMETSKLMNIKKATDILEKVYENLNLGSMSFSVFPLPTLLGKYLNENKNETSHDTWKQEWRYSSLKELRPDLMSLLARVEDMFSVDKLESEMHG